MNKQILEIDVDGVLANMDGSYAPYLSDIIPDFTEKKYIDEWNMPIVAKNYPIAFERVKKLWTNPDFIYSLPRYPGVVEGFKLLDKYCKDIVSPVLHTHILAEGPVYDSREQWLIDLREETNVDFDISIVTGSTKSTLKNSYIVIEDNIKNLNNSSAPYKILIRRCHNHKYTKNDLGTCKESYVFDSFFESVPKVVEILKG